MNLEGVRDGDDPNVVDGKRPPWHKKRANGEG
jgi:hypothetical protein